MGIPAYSVRMAKESDGAISALLKLTQQPDMISFGGGLPSEESFPVEDLKNIINDITADLNGGVLQYGVTEGYLPLREEIVKLMASKGVQISVDEVLVTAGSQQGLDLIAKAFIDKGDKIIVESPTYLAALQAFRMYEAEFIEAPLDEDGVIPAELDRILATEKVKLIYLIPTFQNPSGRTISAERRKELMEVIRKYDVVLIEDDPYGDLKYTDDIYPTMKSMDTTGQVLYFGSFSKIIAPGFRVGYSIASASILSKMVEGKQSCDLHVSIFSQMVIAEYLKRGLLPEHLQVINAQYKEKRDLMLVSLEEHMPDGVTWTHPEGGLFLWLELPAGMSSNELLPEAVNQKVAYVCGDSFYAAGEPKNAMRINFSNATKENIVKGIITLAEVIRNKM